MKLERIEILRHTQSPFGDFAVIKLVGIQTLNGQALYQLRPADGPEPRGWPAGDLKPVAVRTGAKSIELLVGPDIVRSRHLKPGAKVRFLLPIAEIDELLAWPDLSAAPNSASSLNLAAEPPARSTQESPAGSNTPPERGLARLNIKDRRRPQQTPEEANQQQSTKAPPADAPSTPRKLDVKPIKIALQTPAAPVVSSGGAWSLLPMLLGVIIVGAMAVLFVRTAGVDEAGQTLFSLIRDRVNAGEAAQTASRTLNRILAAAEVTTSPSGKDAAGISGREALERANELLAKATTQEERVEAAFWLRKALSGSLSQPRLLWAVTQLGTAYATGDSTNPPDYAAALTLWSWAAEAGDAQAACFLGRLHEQGLGVKPSRENAHRAYLRAQKLGGCPGLRQAMSRVRK